MPYSNKTSHENVDRVEGRKEERKKLEVESVRLSHAAKESGDVVTNKHVIMSYGVCSDNMKPWRSS